jgi:hypothetical protein
MEQAKRYNTGKLRWSLVDFKSLEEMVKVLEFGAKKYDDDNWKKGLPYKEVCESAMRHLLAFMNGHTLDEETGLTHVAHVMTNMMFLQFYMEQEMQQFDNRIHQMPNWRQISVPDVLKAKSNIELDIYKDYMKYQRKFLMDMQQAVSQREMEILNEKFKAEISVVMEDSPMTDEIVEALKCDPTCKGYDDIHDMMYEYGKERPSVQKCPHVMVETDEDIPDTTPELSACKPELKPGYNVDGTKYIEDECRG